MHDMICRVCDSAFRSSWHTAQYCSRQCRLEAASRCYRELNGKPSGLAPGTVGAMHELVVCADLMRRGLHVYRAMSPHNPCDLAAVVGDVTLRIEVTTGIYTNSGKGYSHGKASKVKRFDVLAIVMKCGAIHYEPSIETVVGQSMLY